MCSLNWNKQAKCKKRPPIKTGDRDFHGGAYGDRTRDLMAASHALSQLS